MSSRNQLRVMRRSGRLVMAGAADEASSEDAGESVGELAQVVERLQRGRKVLPQPSGVPDPTPDQGFADAGHRLDRLDPSPTSSPKGSTSRTPRVLTCLPATTRSVPDGSLPELIRTA